MSILHSNPTKKRGRRKKKALALKDTARRKSDLPARRYMGAYVSRAKRAGLSHSQGKPPKIIQLKPSVAKRTEMTPSVAPPFILFLATAEALQRSGITMTGKTSKQKRRLLLLAESVSDGRHHAKILMRAELDEFLCVIAFDEESWTPEKDDVLFDFELKLRRSCGHCVHFYAKEAAMNTGEVIARIIAERFKKYVLGRARLALRTAEIRNEINSLVAEAMQFTLPLSDS